jgi:hypothetical protein
LIQSLERVVSAHEYAVLDGAWRLFTEVKMPTFRAKDAEYPILNLEQGRSVTGWGRMIVYVPDVDAMSVYLKERDFIQRVRKMHHGVSDIFI